MGELQFVPGNTRNFLANWELLTSDEYIVQLARGIPLEFLQEPPIQSELPRYYNFNQRDKLIIDDEVNKLLNRNIISRVYEGWKFR